MRGADDRILEATRRETPVRRLAALLVGCLCAALLGSAPLASWARDLPDGPVADLVQPAAAGWNAAMEGMRLTVPYRRLRAALRALESQ